MSRIRQAFSITWAFFVCSLALWSVFVAANMQLPSKPKLMLVLVVVLIAFVALVVGLAVTSGLVFKRRDPLRKNHLSGSYVRELKAPEPGPGPGQIMVGLARLPLEKESQHVLIEGATGSGKTQLIKQIVHAARARGDTVVIVDTNYDLYNTFGKPGDVVLSPFDPNGTGWVPLNDVRAPTDWSMIGNAFIPEGYGDSRTWNGMARSLFPALAKNYHAECIKAGRPFDTKELFDLLTAADPKIIEPLLVGTSGATLGKDARGLANVRMSYIEALASWPDLKQGTFSLRDWVSGTSRPSIFIPYRKSQIASMKNLISAWLDLFILAAIDAGPSDRRAWLVIDELAGLGEIGALLTGAAELRKTGFRIVAGLQDFTQFRALYGHDRAATLINNLSNKVFLRSTDAEVAERMSRTLGDQRLRIASRTTSVTPGARSRARSSSVTESEKLERAVIASDLMALPDLMAYVKLSGEAAIKKTPLQIYR